MLNHARKTQVHPPDGAISVRGQGLRLRRAVRFTSRDASGARRHLDCLTYAPKVGGLEEQCNPSRNDVLNLRFVYFGEGSSWKRSARSAAFRSRV